jgi:hypothetical protein
MKAMRNLNGLLAAAALALAALQGWTVGARADVASPLPHGIKVGILKLNQGDDMFQTLGESVCRLVKK